MSILDLMNEYMDVVVTKSDFGAMIHGDDVEAALEALELAGGYENLPD